jgi:hypothetical protein
MNAAQVQQDKIRAMLDSMPSISWADAFDPPPPLRFILPGLLEGGAGLIVGQGAIGKTFLALEILRGFAMGDGIAQGTHGALYSRHEIGEGAAGAILGEDPPEIICHRLHALIQGHRMERADAQFLGAVLDIKSAVKTDMALVAPGPHGLVPGPFYTTLKAFCDGKKLVVVDPLLFLAGGVDEKDNAGMGMLMRLITRIAHETGCAILVLHHVGKGDDGREEAARARGASSITTSARLQLDVRPPSAMEMQEYGIPAAERDFYVRVAQVKANYSAPRDVVWLRRCEGGVLRHVRLQRVQVQADEPRGRKGGRSNGAI